MSGFVIDVGRQTNVFARTDVEGCWRSKPDGDPCRGRPDPGSPSGMCRWHRAEWLDDHRWMREVAA